MTEIKLYFTDLEMETFLTKSGYIIETVQAWYDSDAVEDHGKDMHCSIKIATLNGIENTGIENWNRDMLLSSFSIPNMFRKLLAIKLLKL